MTTIWKTGPPRPPDHTDVPRVTRNCAAAPSRWLLSCTSGSGEKQKCRVRLHMPSWTNRSIHPQRVLNRSNHPPSRARRNHGPVLRPWRAHAAWYGSASAHPRRQTKITRLSSPRCPSSFLLLPARPSLHPRPSAAQPANVCTPSSPLPLGASACVRATHARRAYADGTPAAYPDRHTTSPSLCLPPSPPGPPTSRVSAFIHW